METIPNPALVAINETVSRVVRLSRADIAAFAQISGDANPLHSDAAIAARARFGEIIASGQHTSALLMGLLATHFSRSDETLRREMLCLNVNFAFKHPVFADQDVTLRWRVSSLEWKDKLGGFVVQLDGSAGVAHAQPALVARGTILVKEPVSVKASGRGQIEPVCNGS